MERAGMNENFGCADMDKESKALTDSGYHEKHKYATYCDKAHISAVKSTRAICSSYLVGP